MMMMLVVGVMTMLMMLMAHGEIEGLQLMPNCLFFRLEKAEERELKAQLLVKDLKAIQAENKSLAKKFAQSNKT